MWFNHFHYYFSFCLPLQVIHENTEDTDGGRVRRRNRIRAGRWMAWGWDKGNMKSELSGCGWGKGEVKDRDRVRWVSRQMSEKQGRREDECEREEGMTKTRWATRQEKEMSVEGWKGESRSDGSDRVSGRHREGELDSSERTVEGKEGDRTGGNGARKKERGGETNKGEETGAESQMRTDIWRGEPGGGQKGCLERKRGWIKEKKRERALITVCVRARLDPRC